MLFHTVISARGSSRTFAQSVIFVPPVFSTLFPLCRTGARTSDRATKNPNKNIKYQI